MSKVLATVVIVIVLAAVGWVAFGRSDNKANTPATTNSSSTNKSSDQATSQPSATNSVTIQDSSFSPQNITVKKGTVVTWTNQDAMAHTVTETDSQTGPDSPNLSNGKTYSFTFDTTGTYHYHCSIHSNMTGTVTVTE